MIYAQRVNNPSGAAMLLFGQTQSGNVASGAQSNSYVFMASAGDVVDLTIAATSGSFSPRIRLYNSAGQLVSSGSNGFCEGSTLELNTVTLKTSGTYTLLAADCSDTNTGNYMIYGQRTNSSFGPAALLFGGQTQAGNIVSAAQSNTFLTFSGAASSVVDLTMVTISGNLSPRIRLYESHWSADRLCEQWILRRFYYRVEFDHASAGRYLCRADKRLLRHEHRKL